MEPSVGRIVHYLAREYSADSPEGNIVSYPAVILKVHNRNLVDLLVHGPENDERRTSVDQFIDGDLRPGTWMWPPRV